MLVSRAEVVVGAVGAIVAVVDIVVLVLSVGAKVLSVKCVAAVDFSSVTGN